MTASNGSAVARVSAAAEALRPIVAAHASAGSLIARGRPR
jgi:hypothetical protein